MAKKLEHEHTLRVKALTEAPKRVVGKSISVKKIKQFWAGSGVYGQPASPRLG